MVDSFNLMQKQNKQFCYISSFVFFIQLFITFKYCTVNICTEHKMSNVKELAKKVNNICFLYSSNLKLDTHVDLGQLSARN